MTAQSTVEAQLISMAHASKEAVYLSNIMAKLGFGKLFERIPLFGDNTGALHIVETAPTAHAPNTSLCAFFT